MSDELLRLLLYATVSTIGALALVFVLRRSLRVLFGAGAAYFVWLLIPAASLAVLIPVRRVVSLPLVSLHSLHIPLSRATAAALTATKSSLAPDLLWIWILGACSLLIIFAWQQLRFVRGLPIIRKQDGFIYVPADTMGPLVVGLIRPKIVLPIDFENRYTDSERDLVLLHERLHVQRGDLIASGVCALLRCIFWFNPLIHLAADRFQLDQELACDESVIRLQPAARPTYASAMLKAQIVQRPLPVACPSWCSSQSR